MKPQFIATCDDHDWEGMRRDSKIEASKDLKAHKEYYPDEPHINSSIEEIEILDNDILNTESREATLEPEIYGYSAMSTLGIGKSFNPVNLLDIKRSAINYEVENDGKVDTNLKAFFVSNYESLKKIFSTDVKLDASYLGQQGSFTSKFTHETVFTSKSVNVMLVAESDFGVFSIKRGDHLTPEAQECLNDPKEFCIRFGTRYVAAEKRKAAIYVLITFHSVNDSSKRTFETSIDISAGFGELSGAASAQFNQEIKATAKSDRLVLNVHAIGGEGIRGLTDLIIQTARNVSNPLSNIKAALQETMKKFNKDNASPYAFSIASMRKHGLKEEFGIKWDAYRADCLVRLKEIYDEIHFKTEILKQIKSKNHILYFIYDDTTYWDDIDARIKDGEEFKDYLIELHSNCRNNEDRLSFKIPETLPNLIDSSLIARSIPPIVRFKGFYSLDNPDVLLPMRIELAERLLNAKPIDRPNILNNIFPGASSFRSEISPSGIGLSVFDVIIEIRDITRRQRRAKIFYGGRADINLDLIVIENEMINILINLARGTEDETRRYACLLTAKVTDRTRKSYNFILMKATARGRRKKLSGLNMTYFPIS